MFVISNIVSRLDADICLISMSVFLNLSVADTHVWLTSSDLRLNATSTLLLTG